MKMAGRVKVLHLQGVGEQIKILKRIHNFLVGWGGWEGQPNDSLTFFNFFGKTLPTRNMTSLHIHTRRETGTVY